MTAKYVVVDICTLLEIVLKVTEALKFMFRVSFGPSLIAEQLVSVNITLLDTIRNAPV